MFVKGGKLTFRLFWGWGGFFEEVLAIWGGLKHWEVFIWVLGQVW
jgi:hypothetical protein